MYNSHPKLPLLSQCFAYSWQYKDICIDNAYLRLSVIFILYNFHSLLTYFSSFSFTLRVRGVWTLHTGKTHIPLVTSTKVWCKKKYLYTSATSHIGCTWQSFGLCETGRVSVRKGRGLPSRPVSFLILFSPPYCWKGRVSLGGCMAAGQS